MPRQQPTRMAPEDFLEYAIVRVASMLEARFRRALAPFELTPHQFSVLAVVQAHPNQNPAQVARTVMLTPQSLGVIVDQLEASGLLMRTGERRKGVPTMIQISAEGLKRLRTAGRAVRKLDEQTRRHLGTSYADLKQGIDLLSTYLDGDGGGSR